MIMINIIPCDKKEVTILGKGVRISCSNIAVRNEMRVTVQKKVHKRNLTIIYLLLFFLRTK